MESAQASFRHLDAAYFVVAEVVEAKKHPEADKLTITKVDDGVSTLQVVCGAKNVRIGLKVALARMGAVMPSGLNIKESKLRGVISEGMLCSTAELGLKPFPGIIELPGFLPNGKPLKELELVHFFGLDPAQNKPVYETYEAQSPAWKHPLLLRKQEGEDLAQLISRFGNPATSNYVAVKKGAFYNVSGHGFYLAF